MPVPPDMPPDPLPEEDDPSLRNIDRLLGSILRPAPARERLRQSILVATQSPATGGLRTQVLASTVKKARQIRAIYWAIGTAAAVAILMTTGRWLLPQDQTPEFARLSELSGTVRVQRSSESFNTSGRFDLKPGDQIEAGASAHALLTFQDGTQLDLEADTTLALFQHEPNHARELRLTRGAVYARVAKQPTRTPLTLQTPHATIAVIGTRFRLAAESSQTSVAVDEGRVEVTHAGDDQPVSIDGGQFAVVAPGMKLTARALAIAQRHALPHPTERDVFLWPFAARSPWNIPIGSDATFVSPPAAVAEAAASLRGVAIQRPVLRELPIAPLRDIYVRGQRMSSIRVLDQLPLPPHPLFLLSFVDPVSGQVTELLRPRRLPSGDLEADEVGLGSAYDVGAAISWRGIPGITGSAIAGVVRRGEFATGIRHALALNVPRSWLTAAAVWPASPALVSGSRELRLGTLLAIPPEVDLRALGLTSEALEFARALQDYGAYVSSTLSPGVHIFITGEVPAGLDQTLARLLPLLRIVSNNASSTRGGGGLPRRPLAPEWNR